MDELKPMTNKEAAEILKNLCRNVRFGRGNARSMVAIKCTQAIIKAIRLLETTPDEES